MAEARTGPHIRALTGLRALPPLLLVLFHFCEGHGYRGVRPFDLLVAKGYLWVEFFFVLSGFVLTYAYAARRETLWRAPGYLAFMRARLTRLYPLHLFILLVILAMVIGLRVLARQGGYASIYDVPYAPVVTAGSFVANLLLVQAWNVLPELTWNSVAWFVSVEFLLCLLFPLYLALAGRTAWRGAALLLAGLAGSVGLCLTHGHLDMTFHDGIYRGMAEFAIGVGAATLWRGAHDAGWSPSTPMLNLAQGAVLAMLVYGVFFTGWSHTRADLWTALPIMALVPVLSFDRGFLAAPLMLAPMQTLGRWSYAIYLGQRVWLQLIRFFETRLYPPGDTLVAGVRWDALLWWGEPLVLLLVCVAWGALLYCWIEQPAADAIKRHTGPA